jgi:osomolarity two-component system phosphorelay intermediate protein YPD1
MRDASGTKEEPDVQKCLDRLETTIAAVKSDYYEVEKELRKFYKDT